MTDAAIDSRPSTSRPKRHDHSMFEAELSGNVLNLHLLGRIMHWLKPYRLGLFVSAFFVLVASVLAVLMEIVGDSTLGGVVAEFANADVSGFTGESIEGFLMHSDHELPPASELV